MYYVYILKSLGFKRKYIGCTCDLKKRFALHNEGRVKSTKANIPWKLVYYEAFDNKYDAFNREKQLKNDYTAKRKLLGRISSL